MADGTPRGLPVEPGQVPSCQDRATVHAEAKRRLYQKLHSMLKPLNLNEGHLIHRFAYMKNEIPAAGCAHQAGTVRFGTDPASSRVCRTAWNMRLT